MTVDRRFYWSYIRDGFRYERKFDGRRTTINLFVTEPQEKLVFSWKDLPDKAEYFGSKDTAIAAIRKLGYSGWIKQMVPGEASRK